MIGGEVTISFTIQLKADTVADFESAAYTLQHRMSMVLPGKTILCWPHGHDEGPSRVELVKVTQRPLFL